MNLLPHQGACPDLPDVGTLNSLNFPPWCRLLEFNDVELPSEPLPAKALQGAGLWFSSFSNMLDALGVKYIVITFLIIALINGYTQNLGGVPMDVIVQIVTFLGTFIQAINIIISAIQYIFDLIITVFTSFFSIWNWLSSSMRLIYQFSQIVPGVALGHSAGLDFV